MTTLKEEATQELRDRLREGDTIYSIVRSVAASGMSRVIDFYVIRDDRPQYLTGWMANALDLPLKKNGISGVRVTGAGMDMCFATVYELSRKLFNDGYKLKSETL